jgi:hypothetical protein
VPVPIEQAIRLALPGAEHDVAGWVEELKKEEAKRVPGSEESQAFKALLKNATPQERKQLQDALDEGMKTFTANLRNARAKLTSVTKGAPACRKNDLPQAEAGDGAEALVTPSPDYFDKKLAKDLLH